MSIDIPLNRNDLGVVREPVDQGDGTRRVGKDGGPVLEDDWW